MKDKKKIIIVLIVLIAIGFAAVSTTLMLTGVLNIGANKEDFNVYFSKAYENGVENNDLIVDNTHIEFDVDFSAVDDEYELKYEVTNGSRNYDVEVSLGVPEDTEYFTVTNEFNADTLLARTSREGVLTIKLTKAVTEDVEVPLELSINVNAIERSIAGSEEIVAEKEKKVVRVLRGDGTNLGDEIAIGTEEFYVLSNDGDNIETLAKYNLNLAKSYAISEIEAYESDVNDTQNNTMIGFQCSGAEDDSYTCEELTPFSNDDKHGETYYSYEGSIIENYVNLYVKILKDKYNVAASGRIIAKEDLDELAGEEVSTGANLTNYPSIPSWIYSKSYWTSCYLYGQMWNVRSDGRFANTSPNDVFSFGVRPVITIAADLI